MIVLTQKQANDLIEFVEEKVATASCKHHLNFALQWAKANNIDEDDFLDAMVEQGCGCDCEILLNLPENGAIEIEEKHKKEDDVNPFKIPTVFVENTERTYTKAVFTSEDLEYNKYTQPNELLIPAPYGYKPKKKIAKSDWFFISTVSELPNVLGFVKEIDPITASDFAHQIRNTKSEPLKNFSTRAAAYYLSRIDSLPIGNGAWCDFLERTGIGGFSVDLKINKVVR